jgi:hypothetical protein
MTKAESDGPDAGLNWSLAAMNDATDRVNKIPATDLPRAFGAIGEAVWWITIVSDRLRKKYGEVYRQTLGPSASSTADQVLGLKSVRNRIGHAVDLVEFVSPIVSRPDRGDGRITAWTWQHVPPPARGDDMNDRVYQWALKCHQAYELAVVEGGQGGNIVYTFGLVTGSLDLAYQRMKDLRVSQISY